jgi:hypothetical protein
VVLILKYQKMKNLKTLLFIVVTSMIFSTCKKNSQALINVPKPELSGQPELYEIVRNLPQPLINYLDNPYDSEEEDFDRALYYLAKSLRIFACDEEFLLDVRNFLNEDGELLLDDFLSIHNNYFTDLENELSNHGYSYNSLKSALVYDNVQFPPSIKVDNFQTCNWFLSKAIIGIGAEADFQDSIGDFVPAWYPNEGCNDWDEILIGKRFGGAELNEALDLSILPITDIPILIVGYNIDENDEHLFLVIIDGHHDSTENGEILFDPRAPGNVCNDANYIQYKNGHITKRNESRTKHSEWRVRTMNLDHIHDYWNSKAYDLKSVHKDDINSNISINRNVNLQHPGLPDVNANCKKWLAATYEYDWFATRKRIVHFNSICGIYQSTFALPFDDKCPRIKASVDSKKKDKPYQLIFVEKNKCWCIGEERKYSKMINYNGYGDIHIKAY